MNLRPTGILICLLVVLAITGNGHAAGGYCPIGQVWPGFDPEWIEAGTIGGDGESFLALVDPRDGCNCPVGFEMTTTEVYMVFSDEVSLPYTITVSMGLREAVADPGGPLPWLPGATICETPVRDFTAFIPKDFVGFGIALECDCRSMEEPYFLSFTIHSTMEPAGGFYTDGSGVPEPGRYLTSVDGQWIDLVTVGRLTRGDLVLSGSAQCCETPVAVSESSWSSVRGLYRR